MKACYKIPAQNLHILEAKLQKLNKRAAKLGVSPFSFSVIKHETDCEGRVHTWINLEGDAPIMEGYTFLGSLEFMGDICLYHSVETEVEVPEHFYTTPTRQCNHCETDRRRKNIYLLQHIESKNIIQVGSSCLSDFIRDADTAHKIAFFETNLHELEKSLSEESEYYTSNGDDLYEIEYFLHPAASIIKLAGWMSKAKAEEFDQTATIELVNEFLLGKGKYADEFRREAQVTEEHKTLVSEALVWVKGQEDTNGDYFTKLNAIVEYGYCNFRNASLLISLIGSFNGYLAREAKKKTKTEVIEGKLEIRGTVIKTDCSYNAYGSRPVMTVEDARGFLLWGTIPSALHNVKVGSLVRFNANVTQSDSDKTFGFFKRPSKAQELENL